MTKTKLLRYALGIAALAGFLASLAVHVEALMGVDVATAYPRVWLLHLGVFLVFGPFVLLSRKDFTGNLSWRDMAKSLPHGITVLGGAIFVYAIVNLFLFMLDAHGGKPTIAEGKYLLVEHGKLIRELTPAEFAAYKANELRGFSGYWLVFYFFPAAYFLFWKSPPAQDASRSSDGIA